MTVFRKLSDQNLMAVWNNLVTETIWRQCTEGQSVLFSGRFKIQEHLKSELTRMVAEYLDGESLPYSEGV